MKYLKSSAVLAGALVFTAACGGSSDEPAKASSVEQQVAKQVEAATGMKASQDDTPCKILDDELIRAHFTVPEGAEITRNPSKFSPYPLCMVSWPKPNAAEIQAQIGQAMQDYMKKKMAGEDVKMPVFRTTDEVSLTLYEPPFDSPEAARRGLESAMDMLSKGITGSHKDVEVTIQADATPVEGVGDEAMWVARMHQLSLTSGVRLLHISVRTADDPEVDKPLAVAVARDVIERL